MLHLSLCVCAVLLNIFFFSVFTILKRSFSNRSMWLSGKIISVTFRIWYKFWYVSTVSFIFTYSLSCEYLIIWLLMSWHDMKKIQTKKKIVYGLAFWIRKLPSREPRKKIGWLIGSVDRSIGRLIAYMYSYSICAVMRQQSKSLTLKRIRA